MHPGDGNGCPVAHYTKREIHMTRFRSLSAALVIMAAACWAQTAPVQQQTRCSGIVAAGQIVIPVSAPSTGLSQSQFMGCLVLDPLYFSASNGVLTLKLPAGDGKVWVLEAPSGVVDGANAQFSTVASNAPITGTILLFRNGILQKACPAGGSVTAQVSCDYSWSGNTAQFLTTTQTLAGIATIPTPGDVLQFYYAHQ